MVAIEAGLFTPEGVEVVAGLIGDEQVLVQERERGGAAASSGESGGLGE
jgi:hypothetical protein